MKNWYKKASADNRFWEVWKRNDTYSKGGLPIYISKSEYGQAALVLDLPKNTIISNVFLDPKSVPIGYDNADLKLGNSFEGTTSVQSRARMHTAQFIMEPSNADKIASSDADGSLWWFTHMRLWRTPNIDPVIAGSDDVGGISKFGNEIVGSMAGSIRKWASSSDWERIQKFLVSSEFDLTRTLSRASLKVVKKLGSSITEALLRAPDDFRQGDAFLVENWDNILRRGSCALATIAAREEK